VDEFVKCAGFGNAVALLHGRGMVASVALIPQLYLFDPEIIEGLLKTLTQAK
jgi:hypothetical protein